MFGGFFPPTANTGRILNSLLGIPSGFLESHCGFLEPHSDFLEPHSGFLEPHSGYSIPSL